MWAPNGQPRGVFRFTIDNGKITEIQLVADPAQALAEAVVDKLTTEVLTLDNLRRIADELAKELTERNQDASQPITVAQGKLVAVRAALDKLMDALGKSDFSTSIQRRLTEREAEEHELISEIANLESM